MYFLVAVRCAMSISSPRPPFGDEIRTSAQVQIDCMQGEDDESPLVAAEAELKSDIRNGLSQLCFTFQKEFCGLWQCEIASHMQGATVEDMASYIQKMKPVLDSVGSEQTGFPYRIDGRPITENRRSYCFTYDQIEILDDWMDSEKLVYPDLTEAFGIWCYRTKSSKRWLVQRFDRVTLNYLPSFSLLP